MFGALPDALQQDLRSGATVRTFSDGQLIHQRGDRSDGFWVIETGQVKMGRYQPEGDMRVFAILGSGDSFGEPACFGEFNRVADAVALGSVRLLWIGKTALFAMLDHSPIAARALLRVLSIQFQEALDGLLVVRKMPPRQQLARILTTLCAAQPAPVTLKVRHEELAELIGVSRMTIGTLLTGLEAEGLLTRGYRQLIVNDPEALRHMSML
jgi:CRP/FNR family transcriptional regulator, cyclic AMP receptor protein